MQSLKKTTNLSLKTDPTLGMEVEVRTGEVFSERSMQISHNESIKTTVLSWSRVDPPQAEAPRSHLRLLIWVE